MRLTIAATLGCLVLAGCVTRASLVAGDTQQRYEVHVDQFARQLTTTIDGVFYTGTAVGDESVGIASGQSFGLRPTFSTTTVITQGSGGRALFISDAGDTIECGFTKNGTTIIGRCQSNKGRQFVLTTM